MANLQAIGFDGETIIYLLADGAGTDLDPFVSKFKLVDQDLLATESGLTAIADLIPEFVFDETGKLSVVTGLDLSTLATKAKQDDLLAKIPNNLTVDGDQLKIKTELSQPLTLAELSSIVVATQEQSPLDLEPLAKESKQDATNTRLGEITEVAPSTDTASSGLNGRLQRIAQRLTSLIGLFPASLGVKTAANSLAVALATDGVAADISGKIGEVQTSPTANTVLDRLKVIVTALGSITLASESGFLRYRNVTLSSTPQQIKSGAGSLMGWNAINPNTTAIYVKFYDAASPTLGTTTPILTIMIPPGDGVSPGFFFQEPSLVPIEVFSTAMSVACVTGLADNSTTAPSTAIHFSARYK